MKNSIISTIAISFATLSLYGCGGGGSGGGGGGGGTTLRTTFVGSTGANENVGSLADIDVANYISGDQLAGLTSTAISGNDIVGIGTATGSITRPTDTTIQYAGQTYTFDTHIDNDFVTSTDNNLIVADTDTLNIGLTYARITVIDIVDSMNTADDTDDILTGLAHVQTSRNPTNNLPTGASASSIEYTGFAFGESVTGPIESDFSGSFTMTADFSTPSGAVTATVTENNVAVGNLVATRGTGHEFSGTYTGTGTGVGVTSNINGGFYGPNAAEVSGIGVGTGPDGSGGTEPYIVGFLGKRSN